MIKVLFLLYLLFNFAQANQKIEIRGIENAQKTKEIEAKLTKIIKEKNLFALTELLKKYRLRPSQQLSSESVMVYEVKPYSELYNAVKSSKIPMWMSMEFITISIHLLSLPLIMEKMRLSRCF